MTPLAPLEPYIAVDEASFSTSIDFISAGFMALRLPPGKPSITTSGPQYIKFYNILIFTYLQYRNKGVYKI